MRAPALLAHPVVVPLDVLRFVVFHGPSFALSMAAQICGNVSSAGSGLSGR
ncbi:hypothetical protein LCGC14_3074210, partial [marine sediment metagenome]